MDSKATVQALMDSIQKGDFEKAKLYLSNDFQFSGAVPEPIISEAWLGMSMSLKKAFPNLEYHFRVECTDGETAHTSAKLKGTNSGDFDLTGMHMGVIPATNKSFAVAQEYGQATVKSDRVTSWAVQSTPGGGLMAILEQLGVKLPSM